MYTIEVGQPFSNSNHCSVDFTDSFNIEDDDTSVDTNQNWKDADRDGMIVYLNVINRYETSCSQLTLLQIDCGSLSHLICIAR